MSKTNAPQEAIDLLEKLKIDPAVAMWDCHGTWVMKHFACERIGAHLKIKWDMPVIIEQEGGKSVSMVVRGAMDGGHSEWSIGEASTKNCKNAYFWAMAEKRAKDRVILKLAGFHGSVYSQEESDDFNPSRQANKEMTGGQHFHFTQKDQIDITNIVEMFDTNDRSSFLDLWGTFSQEKINWVWANIPTRGNGLPPKTKIQQTFTEWLK